MDLEASEVVGQKLGGGVGRGDSQLKGTALQLLQDPTVHDKLEHLLIGQALVGLFSQGHDLPEHHTKGPGGHTGGPELSTLQAAQCDPRTGSVPGPSPDDTSTSLEPSDPAKPYQTSECVVKIPSLRDSGAIQRTGSSPFPPLR